jgi:hypothetical protein
MYHLLGYIGPLIVTFVTVIPQIHLFPRPPSFLDFSVLAQKPSARMPVFTIHQSHPFWQTFAH